MEKFTVLVVDDDSNWCETLREQLAAHHMFTPLTPVNDGELALGAIKSKRPDVIILDLMLPIYDGMYIADVIANKIPDYNPFVYVLSVMSAESTNRILQKCEAVDYFSIKPIHPKALISNLVRFMETRETESDNMSVNSSANLDYIIEDYLLKLGIPTAMISAKCARIAIELAMKVGKNDRPDMIGMYETVGKVFKPPLSRPAVERNIRSCIKRVGDSRTSFFEKSPLNINGKIVSTFFIYESAKYLKKMIEDSGNGAILDNDN